MPHELFKPDPEEHQTIQDLPAEERQAFVELPEGGYVRASAWQEFQKWEKEAEEANAGRSLFKKVLGISRKTFIDYAREDSAEEYQERETITGHLAELSRNLNACFTDILTLQREKFDDLIDSGQITSVISEDGGGRIPAEVLQLAISEIYRSQGRSGIPLLGIASREGGRVNKRQALELIESGQIGRGALYVTEYVFSGGASRAAFEALSAAARDKRERGQEIPEFFAFLSLAGGRGPETIGDYQEAIRGIELEIGKLQKAISGMEQSSETDETKKVNIHIWRERIEGERERIVRYHRFFQRLADESTITPRTSFRPPGYPQDSYKARMFSHYGGVQGFRGNKHISTEELSKLRERLIQGSVQEFLGIYRKEERMAA